MGCDMDEMEIFHWSRKKQMKLLIAKRLSEIVRQTESLISECRSVLKMIAFT